MESECYLIFFFFMTDSTRRGVKKSHRDSLTEPVLLSKEQQIEEHLLVLSISLEISLFVDKITRKG